jgi:hypothetical protein
MTKPDAMTPVFFQVKAEVAEHAPDVDRGRDCPTALSGEAASHRDSESVVP